MRCLLSLHALPRRLQLPSAALACRPQVAFEHLATTAQVWNLHDCCTAQITAPGRHGRAAGCTPLQAAPGHSPHASSQSSSRGKRLPLPLQPPYTKPLRRRAGAGGSAPAAGAGRCCCCSSARPCCSPPPNPAPRTCTPWRQGRNRRKGCRPGTAPPPAAACTPRAAWQRRRAGGRAGGGGAGVGGGAAQPHGPSACLLSSPTIRPKQCCASHALGLTRPLREEVVAVGAAAACRRTGVGTARACLRPTWCFGMHAAGAPCPRMSGPHAGGALWRSL